MLLLVLLCGVLRLSSAAFEPLLNVESCTKSKLTVSTFEATDNGLIFIQGQGETCKQQTTSGLAYYDFDFSSCGIDWEMLFKIVIQKNSGYQTGADKVIPIFCIADQSDLIVSNSNSADKLDDLSMNMTVKPTANMRFYKVVSDEEVSGKEVKLSDVLIMTLELSGDFTDDFDIKARYCIASEIVIISDYCATDTDLFPNFSRFKRGYLMSEFGAFRATSLQGGEVQMNFTCVLQVCKDDCEETNCNGNGGWGRKRRDLTLGNGFDGISNNLESSAPGSDLLNHSRHHLEKRQAENFDIDVGGRVKIVEKYSEIQIVTSETMCVNAALLVCTMILLGACCLTFGTTSVIFYRKMSAAQAQARAQYRGSSCSLATRKDSLQFDQSFNNRILNQF